MFATSQIKTYDCLTHYDAPSESLGIRYASSSENPLGVSPFILGDHPRFQTGLLTLEFKNNLDGLIDELDGETPKKFSNINICVCWGTVGTSFKGYQLEEVTPYNIDERQYPGVTHLLRKDGEGHVIQVIMLTKVVDIIKAGNLKLSA